MSSTDHAPSTAGEWHVTVQFTRGGPVMRGIWTRQITAERKFLSLVGLYGSLDGVVITLWRDDGDGLVAVKTWTKDAGEQDTG